MTASKRVRGNDKRTPVILLASPLEILDGALVTLGGLTRVEGAQVAALAGLRIFLTRIQTILT